MQHDGARRRRDDERPAALGDEADPTDDRRVIHDRPRSAEDEARARTRRQPPAGDGVVVDEPDPDRDEGHRERRVRSPVPPGARRERDHDGQRCGHGRRRDLHQGRDGEEGSRDPGLARGPCEDGARRHRSHRQVEIDLSVLAEHRRQDAEGERRSEPQEAPVQPATERVEGEHRDGQERQHHRVRHLARLAEGAPREGDERHEERRVREVRVRRDERREARVEHVACRVHDEPRAVPEVRKVPRRPPCDRRSDDDRHDRGAVCTSVVGAPVRRSFVHVHESRTRWPASRARRRPSARAPRGECASPSGWRERDRPGRRLAVLRRARPAVPR